MLSVLMLSVLMQSVLILSVLMLSVLMLSVIIMLIVVILSVAVLIVSAPNKIIYRDVIGAAFVSVPRDGLHPHGRDDPAEAAEPLHDDDVTAGPAGAECSSNTARAAPHYENLTFGKDWDGSWAL
jgi:hypothetical protein